MRVSSMLGNSLEGAANAALATSLSKLCRPVFKLFQTLLAHTRPDIDKTMLEVLQTYRADVFRRHVQQLLTQAAQRTHRRIFRQSRDV